MAKTPVVDGSDAPPSDVELFTKFAGIGRIIR